MGNCFQPYLLPPDDVHLEINAHINGLSEHIKNSKKVIYTHVESNNDETESLEETINLCSVENNLCNAIKINVPIPTSQNFSDYSITETDPDLFDLHDINNSNDDHDDNYINGSDTDYDNPLQLQYRMSSENTLFADNDNYNDNDDIDIDIKYDSDNSSTSSFSFVPNKLGLSLGLHLQYKQDAVNTHYGWVLIDNLPKVSKPQFYDINIDYLFLEKYQKHLYINKYQPVIDGYMREMEFEVQLHLDNTSVLQTSDHLQIPFIIPDGVKRICCTYYFDPQQYITQTLYRLCTMISKFDIETVNHLNGITGQHLFSKISEHISNIILNNNIELFCNHLIEYGFIKLIAVRRILAINDYKFHNNDKYLYQFNNTKISNLIEYKTKYELNYDRCAWNINTEVEIYCNKINKWITARIIQIDNYNKLTVLITSTSSLKTVLRYKYNEIRSTKRFIQQRKRLGVNDVVDVYDTNNKVWINGIIKDIKIPNPHKNYIDVLTVIYNQTECVTLQRWSPNLR